MTLTALRPIGIALLGVLGFGVVACQPNCSDIAFPATQDSPYVLPYSVGVTHLVSQSYCNARGGHRNRVALDFAMPMGAPIVAARGGEVLEVVSHFEDGDLRRGHNNRVLVRHEDGSIAWYAHLQHDSVSVSEGDRVEQGEPLARCGNTGNTGNLPHLHFEVFRTKPYVYADAIPVSFRNARGSLDARGGLIGGELYEAAASAPTVAWRGRQ